MNKLEAPQLKYKNILIKCVEGIHDKVLEESVYRNIDNFISRSEEYKSLAENGTLFQIERVEKDNFSKEEMLFLYKKLRGSPHARKYYEYLLNSSNFCPYCGVQLSRTIDHYLPKSHYPMYSIVPNNLVPSCSDCNHNKLDHLQEQGEETFHPYFDKLSSHRFLFVEIINLNGDMGITYHLRKPIDLSDFEFNKLKKHFTQTKLNELYSGLASGEVHSQLRGLQNLFNLGGANEVAKSLEESYLRNLEVGVNGWKTALYEALSRDVWFHSTGINVFRYSNNKSDASLIDEVELEIPKQT